MPILYLHGFRSTPRSAKAVEIRRRMAALGRAAEYDCPQLPASPAHAARLIRERAALLLSRTALAAYNESGEPKPENTLGQSDWRDAGPLTVVGSSLGGYYATWLAEAIGCRAVLLNPAVHPDRDLGRHLGVQTVYGSDETIEVKAEFMQEFRDLRVPRITRPERYFLVAATGDEVLDWREMVEKYPGTKLLIIEGGDHGLSDFDAIADEVMRFAGYPFPNAGRNAAR